MSQNYAILLGIAIGVSLYSIYTLLVTKSSLVSSTFFFPSSSSSSSSTTNPSSSISSSSSPGLPPGLTVQEACQKLERKYHVSQSLLSSNANKNIGFSNISPSVQYHWISLGCSQKLLQIQSYQEEVASTPVLLNKGSKTIIEEIAETKYVESSAGPKKNLESSLSSSSPLSTTPLDHHNSISTQESKRDSSLHRCIEMKEAHSVVPGSSWGSLPTDLQKQWSRMECDTLLRTWGGEEHASAEGDVEETVEFKPTQTELDMSSSSSSGGSKINARKDDSKTTLLSVLNGVIGKKVENKENDEDLLSKNKHALAALPSVTPLAEEWCAETKSKYAVQPMKSWGKLPMNMIEVWKNRNCDLVFTAQRMGKRTVSTCPGQKLPLLNNNDKTKTRTNVQSIDVKLPLIAIMAATTTRKVVNPSTNNLALFTYLLPSLIRSLDCGYRYEYILGFDKGDPFYDSDKGMKEVRDWFKKKIQEPMEHNGISLTLRTVKVNNSLKKPGPVFLEMARAAFEAGAEYFYRINDDTELVGKWPSRFVAALHSMPPPLGVVGPTCNQGNQKILTHDFVHRTHMEVFEMNYYPAELTDWWMDDWISLVYGKSRTLKSKQTTVIHHTGAHGQRYEVDRSHERLLMKLVESGRVKIRQWMLQKGVSESELKAFDVDEYKPGFKHNDIPSPSLR